MSKNDSPDSPTWPEETFPFAPIQAWVAATLFVPDASSVQPVTLYANYTTPPDIRLTARLSYRDRQNAHREVVFKENRFPLLSGSARAHALVARYAPGMVPNVLTWEEEEGQNRLLYTPFVGQSVGESQHPEGLVETARTLARIQQATIAATADEGTGIPSATTLHIPLLFAEVIAHITTYESVWRNDNEGQLTRWLRFPARDILSVLDATLPLVRRYAETVSALDLPITIDHGDLHGGNAIVQENGSILIYDWETATVGCPLFSLEKLLVAAWTIDTNPDGYGPWGYLPNTPTQARVRDAYLGEWGRTDITTEVFAAAMCLATIKEMHAEITWANTMGWPAGNPEWTAQLISRMRHHMRTMP